MSVATQQRRLTPQQLVSKKRQGEKIISLTAYDYSTAKLMDETGDIDFILVGDSLGMVVLGYPDTLSVTMDEMLHHVKAVSRGTRKAMLIADMPFLSVHVDLPSAVRNAGRMIQEGHANAVKIEGASTLTLELVRHLTAIGIPVMGHLGFTPQFVRAFGGFKVQAKSIEAVEQLIHDAQALEAAGCFALVLEMVPAEVATLITRVLSIPTIGIGAGAGCDGQILVVDDFIGKFPDFKPKFVRQYAHVAETLQSAIRQYKCDILSGDFPAPETETFGFPPELLGELRALEGRLALPVSAS
jgi:3-methyl-2-oxobutanoate hydroxymethyltransferase